MISEIEKTILTRWNTGHLFEQSLSNTEDMDVFSFYDGPPFATGLPHYGHILAGTIKDVITRWATQTGHHVQRRFGWDTHGLPVEFEVNRLLDVTTSDDVYALDGGISEYNNRCRSLIKEYTDQWTTPVERSGRWIDIKNSYKTMDTDYMESVWWAFCELNKKGLIYRGTKIMPYSTGLSTPLSNFEAKMDFHDVSDPEIYIKFPVVGMSNTYLLVMTTTPWTLTSNRAIAYSSTIEYIAVTTDACVLIMASKTSRTSGVPFDMSGVEYICPLDNKQYQTIQGTFITTDKGTGLVHMAPGFGEDDYYACKANGIEPFCPVDNKGCFTDEVPEYSGRYVFDCNDDIIKTLKKCGVLYRKSTIVHSFPFCWRSKTRLIYRIIPAWFVSVEQLKDRLLETAMESRWTPETIQTKRFLNWIKGARDWCISRTRFWGTPLPVWANDDMSTTVFVSSIEQLNELTGITVTDLHLDTIGEIIIQSPDGPLRLIGDVFDCWFESGSMPYASIHYPFENTEHFERNFPADFCAEGLDQTRGWFYTMLVLSTALFDKSPYKNVIVNGMILAEDGSKMSKSKGNFTPPMETVERYGADALRLYLIGSPAVRALPLKFSEDGVRRSVSSVILPLLNIMKYIQTSNTSSMGQPTQSTRWLSSITQTLVKSVTTYMNNYNIGEALMLLTNHIELLRNWYIRLNRIDAKTNYEIVTTLRTNFTIFIKLLAPFAPFITEHVFTQLTTGVSIHLTKVPQYKHELVDDVLEKQFDTTMQLVKAGNSLRKKALRPTKMPLNTMIVIGQQRSDVFPEIIKRELNVDNVTFLNGTEEQEWVRYTASLNGRRCGPRLGRDMRKYMSIVNELSHDTVLDIIEFGEITINAYSFCREDFIISMKTVDHDGYILSTGTNTVALDITLSSEQVFRHDVRKLMSDTNTTRRARGLKVGDPTVILCDHMSPVLQHVIDNNLVPGTRFCIQHEDR